ncbi:MAG: hypothetical protein ACTSXL_04225 [Alphaproteobacteria bacterium]
MCKLEDIFSQKRLNKYKIKETDSNKKAFERHLFNSKLAESFFPSLSYFEIILRNKIDKVFSGYFGDGWIFDTRFHLKSNKTAFDFAFNRVERLGKDTNDKNHIISEINLGFWTFLFSSKYNAIIWDNNSKIIKEIFEHAKKEVCFDFIESQLNRIRLYRNKVFHYDAIMLETKGFFMHAQIHNLLNKMIQEIGGKGILSKIKKIDNFNSVYKECKEKGFIIKKKEA